MTSRTFDSTASVGPCSTPWTLSESDALSGVFGGVSSCCSFHVCNFGRGHCAGNVHSSYGWKGNGGCGSNPVVGTSGVSSGVVTISVWQGEVSLVSCSSIKSSIFTRLQKPSKIASSACLQYRKGAQGDCDWHYQSKGGIGVEACANKCAGEALCEKFSYGNSLGCRISRCGSDPGPDLCPSDGTCPLTFSHGGDVYHMNTS